MTTKDSILALAAKISNGTVPNVTTDAQALGELAKAMCGSAPTEPIATVDDAIAYITANYSGGGGVDVGPLAFVGRMDDVPTIGGGWTSDVVIASVKIGDVAIYDGNLGDVGTAANGCFAAGLALTTEAIPSDFADTLSAYVCTVDDSSQYATVEPWDGTLTREDAEYDGDPAYRWAFTMPELSEGEMLILYPHLAD